ncbi:MAG: sensor histidine kinase [Desulfitobacteriaceae bacterium]
MSDRLVLRWIKEWPVWVGLALFMVGVTVPHWPWHETFGLSVWLADLEIRPTGNRLMILVMVLVIFNAVSVLPQNLGALILGDWVGRLSGKPWLRIVAPPGLAIVALALSRGFGTYSTEFGGVALLVLIALTMLQKLVGDRLKLGTKALLLAQLLFGVHWLDVVPWFSQYGFGQGVLVARIENLSTATGFDDALGLYALTLFLGFVGNAVILGALLVLAGQKLEVKQSLHRAQLKAVESRVSQEVLHLVHDLKTPLTAVEGLTSLIQLKADEAKVIEYCQKISEATHSMSHMISEILYGKEQVHCTLQEILNYLLAGCLRAPEIGPDIQQLELANVKVLVNRIRLTRALVNLIDNAFDAVGAEEEGHVILRAKVQGEDVWLGVEDNGPGISLSELNHVWEAGFSTKGHPGLGLAFVRQVAEEHSGSVRLETRLGQGTVAWLQVRKV